MASRVYMSSLRKVFQWILLVPAVVPLIYSEQFIYPATTPKTLLFRGLGIVALALFVYLVGTGESFYWSRLRKKTTWLPALLLAVAYTMSLIGVDFYRSFWSIFARGDGLLTLTICVEFFYLFLLVADRAFVTKMFKTIAWVATLVAGYALLQWLKIATGINLPVFVSDGFRLGGTFDNAAFLASYLGITFFITLSVAREYTNKWRTWGYVGAAAQLLVAILTATRGSLVALGGIGVLALVYWIIKGPKHSRVYAWSTLGACVLLAALFVGFRSQLAYSPLAPIARLASISSTDATTASRLFIWQQVGCEALSKPLTGYGAEHISELFDRVYDPSTNIEQWFDRTHNAFLDYFVQFGVFGLLLYVGLICLLGYNSWRLRHETYGIYILAAVYMYAAQNFFVFDTVSTLWLLFMLFASSCVLLWAEGKQESVRLPGGRGVGALVGTGLLLLLVPVVIQPLRANIYLAEAYFSQVNNPAESVDSLKKGFALGTYGDLEYGYEVYQMYIEGQMARLTGGDLAAAYQEAKTILQANYTRYPYDARTATYFAHILDSAPAGVSRDDALLNQVLDHALVLSPKREQLWYIKANIVIRKGDGAATQAEKTKAYQEAITIVKGYVAQEPTLAEPRYILASLYLILGDKGQAAKWADEALLLYPQHPAGARRAVKYYIGVEDWPHAAQFLKDVVAADPTNYPVVYDYAKTSFLAGDTTKALEIVAMLRQKVPGLVETDPAFMKAIGQ